MKFLVVYDTSYGNTAKVAFAIAAGLGNDAVAIELKRSTPKP
jgi:flavodoxin